MSTTYLYRHFSKDGVLLYIGISRNEPRRRKQHLKLSPWFCIVHSIQVEEWPNRAIAEKVETMAIIKEKPIYNVLDSLTPETAQAMRVEVSKTKEFADHKVHVKKGLYGKSGVMVRLYKKYLEKFNDENQSIEDKFSGSFETAGFSKDPLRDADVRRGFFWLGVSRLSGYSWWWRS